MTDRTRYVAEARRLDGRPWEHIDGAKSYTLPRGSKGRKCWPLGIVEAEKYPAIALVEGAPDFLAAFHWIYEILQATAATLKAAKGKLLTEELINDIFDKFRSIPAKLKW